MHLNRYRYYDPSIGRFISNDPIGLVGGLNLHQYAPNPIEWVDPLGLARLGGGKNMGGSPIPSAPNVVQIRPTFMDHSIESSLRRSRQSELLSTKQRASIQAPLPTREWVSFESMPTMAPCRRDSEDSSFILRLNRPV